MIREMLNIMAPMRDGARLALNLYRPDDDKPYPSIFIRTPYIKENIERETIYANYRQMAQAGYNMIFQDVRGTGMSEGVLDPTGASEIEDGYDTVEWIAAQPWCDGNVGMQGLSYFGYTQMAAAENNPPHLKAICPFQNSAIQPFSVTEAGTFGNYHLMWIYERVLENLDKWVPDAARREAVKSKIEQYKGNWHEVMFKLPLIDTPAARIEGVPQLEAYLELLNGMEDQAFLKRARRPIRVENIKAPMFFLTGWFDGARDGTIDHWNRVANRGQGHKKMIIGPWLHGGKLSSKIDGRDFGDENSGEGAGVQETVKKWFDYWLKGQMNGIADDAPVSIFVLGDNVWRAEREWPLSRAVNTRFYIHGGADKNGGVLDQTSPRDETPQSYGYDPENPLPSSFTDKAGRRIFADAAVQQDREDVLVYSTPPLEADIEVTGPVEFMLYAATDAQDTDFFCRLSDVDQAGYAFPLLTGIVRGRFRNGTEPEMMVPGRIYALTIALGNISNVFKAGHKIRLDISSSFYPEHNRNLNTPDRIGYGKYSIKATQQIYHDSEHPSCLILPVIPKG